MHSIEGDEGAVLGPCTLLGQRTRIAINRGLREVVEQVLANVRQASGKRDTLKAPTTPERKIANARHALGDRDLGKVEVLYE